MVKHACVRWRDEVNARVVTQGFEGRVLRVLRTSKMRYLMMLMITAIATILAPVAGNPFLDAAQGKQFFLSLPRGICKATDRKNREFIFLI